MELNNVQKEFIENKLIKLRGSKFRSSFKLRKNDIDYLNKKDLTIIEEHAFQFVEQRLKPKIILNDGKQTPMRGHPVFVAQHATATCCRGCLYKWYKIDKNKDLSEKEIRFIVALIMEWINKNKEDK